MLPEYSEVPKKILLCSLTFSQIWLSSFLDDGQSTSLTNLKTSTTIEKSAPGRFHIPTIYLFIYLFWAISCTAICRLKKPKREFTN
jgi:hypothetical protein